MAEISVIVGIVGGVLAILFGYAAFARNKKTDDAAEGKESGQILTELGYIKGSVDDIKQNQRETARQHVEVVTRLTAVESAAKEAHHRIDRLEERNDLHE